VLFRSQETRLWHQAEGRTVSMRSKERAHDYRYFPEPDLLPVHISSAWREEVLRSLPELPEAKRARFVSSYGITPYDAEVLTATKALADYFDSVVKAAAREVIVKNPDNVAKYKSGNEGIFKFFVGQVMRATRGQANPQSVNDIVRKLLS